MRFAKLVDCLARLEKTTKRLEMTAALAELFKGASEEDIAPIIYLTQERLGPAFAPIDFGIGDALAAQALAKASGKTIDAIKKQYKTKGDYGTVAENLLKQNDGSKLTVKKVYDQLMQIATTSGEGTVEKKTDLLADLLNKLSGAEARYLLRIPLGRLRLGIGDPTVMESLSWSKTGDKSLRAPIERAYNVCSDLGEVARIFKADGVDALEKIQVKVGNPVRMALAERAKSSEDVVTRLGKCAIEPKYDGLRAQIHKDGDRVRIYSRNLEETTEMFPDIAEGVRKQFKAKTAILEGEALAVDTETGDYLPFQMTTQRKRKHGIAESQAKLPLKLLAFDLLYADGKDVTRVGYQERHALLDKLIARGETLEVAEQLVTQDAKLIEKFFMEKIEHGLEGIMAKRLDSPYQAGARNFNWMKLKRSYQGHLTDTVDGVVVGYLRGRGMRARFGIGALLVALYDDQQDKFVTVAKIGTGFSDEEWPQMRALLDKIALDHPHARVEAVMEPDVWVEPKYVIEMQADEITRSPIHTAGKIDDEPGYALRFPRVKGFIRADKKPEDATTVAEILRMFKKQGSQRTENE
ncbi:MAG: ATP-dependent DNA ligase [Chloroflexi bacterium]|nr:ATP-dependent DNA ligase [Chloroflexota bacterium]